MAIIFIPYMKKALLYLLLFINTALIMISCGSTSGKKSSDIDTTSLKIGVMPTMDCLPFYVAEKSGMFDSLKTDITLKTFDSAMNCDTALAGGSIDGAASDIIKAVLLKQQGDSIKIVMGGDMELYLLTAKSARIRNASSIKEKIVAITRNSAVDFTADKILESVKLGSEELNKPQINSLNIRTQMLCQNQYDGALLPEPYATLCESKGCNRIADSKSLGLRLSALYINEKKIKGHEEDIKKLITAYNDAVEFINKKIEEGKTNQLLSFLPEKFNIPDSLMHKDFMSYASLPTDSALTSAYDWLKERELIKNDKNFGDLIDSTFIKSDNKKRAIFKDKKEKQKSEIRQSDKKPARNIKK